MEHLHSRDEALATTNTTTAYREEAEEKETEEEEEKKREMKFELKMEEMRKLEVVARGARGARCLCTGAERTPRQKNTYTYTQAGMYVSTLLYICIFICMYVCVCRRERPRSRV